MSSEHQKLPGKSAPCCCYQPAKVAVVDALQENKYNKIMSSIRNIFYNTS